MKTTLEAIGNRIKKQRIYYGISQEKMANSLKISVKHYGEIERGISGYTVKNLILISEILCVSIDYLLKGVEYNKISEAKELYSILKICPEEKKLDFISLIKTMANLL